MICTWLFVISGKAPIGICVMENRPKTTMESVKRMMISLFFRLNRMM